MNYTIYNGKIKVITQVINYSFDFKSNDGLKIESVSGKRYVLNDEDYMDVFRKLEFELLIPTNENVSITVQDVDCLDVINYDGMEASSEAEAESIIKNLTLEEQLLESQFELDSLKLGLSE